MGVAGLLGHLNCVVVVLNTSFFKGFYQICDRRTQHHVTTSAIQTVGEGKNLGGGLPGHNFSEW